MTLPAIVVSGFGRCGSSLTMQMLAAGGVPCVGEAPDFEVREASGRIAPEFIASCAGQAVKILDPQTVGLPGHLRVIWLDRDTNEQALSIAKFTHATIGVEYDRAKRRGLARQLVADRPRALKVIGDRLMVRLEFERLLKYPRDCAAELQRRLAWMGLEFDPDAAAKVVIRRPPQCMPTMAIEKALVIREAEKEAAS